MSSRTVHNTDGRVAWEKEVSREATAEELTQIDEVNARLDQFSHYPDMEFLSRHRKFLHHREGVNYFARRYGRLGKIVAEVHILRDCKLRIPKMADYLDGTVNEYGVWYE